MNDRADLLWLDMEMTGLEPTTDKPLEVALIATDWDFKELAAFESGIGQSPTVIAPLLDANPFYRQYADNKKALLKLCADSPDVKVVERQVTEFVKQHFDTTRPVLLAGNSIYQDRRFIRAHMPFFDQQLHYRMLDVSSWKIVFEGKFKKDFKKSESHRALDDIRESIAELKFYLSSINE